MNKWRLIAVLLVGALVVVYAMVVVAPQVILAQVCDRETDRKVLDAQSDFFCPAGNRVVYDAWGECGLKKECINPENGMSNGSKFSAQGGQLQSKALYSQGKQASGWTGYDNDGRALPGAIAPLATPTKITACIVLGLCQADGLPPGRGGYVKTRELLAEIYQRSRDHFKLAQKQLE